MSKLDLTFGAKWQIAKNSDKYQKKYFFYKSIVYIMFLNAYMQISGRLIFIIREVSGNIMLHFMRTGRTICQCHALNIKCTLWFFPKKLWILILIQLVLSWCKAVAVHHTSLSSLRTRAKSERRSNRWPACWYTEVQIHLTSCPCPAPGLLGEQS